MSKKIGTLKVFKFNEMKDLLDSQVHNQLLRQCCYGNFSKEEYLEVVSWLNENCNDYILVHIQRHEKKGETNKFVRFFFKNDSDKIKFLMRW